MAMAASARREGSSAMGPEARRAVKTASTSSSTEGWAGSEARMPA